MDRSTTAPFSSESTAIKPRWFLVEVAQPDGPARLLQEAHPDHGAAHHDVFVPLGGGGGHKLDVHPEGVEIAGRGDRRSLHDGLFVALVVDVVGEIERERALRNGNSIFELSLFSNLKPFHSSS
jgi:hypothetical protein